MIPSLDPMTGYLPVGEHPATWDELQQCFGTTPRRISLLTGLTLALNLLAVATIPRVYVDGSFISAKEAPGDFDACWDWDSNTDFSRLHPIFLDLAPPRANQKSMFGGEIFPADAIADHLGTSFRYFFQRDTRTGSQKGIVVLTLS